MYYDMKKSGARIRQLRTQSGLTQEQASEVLNINRSFYSRIETGQKGCSIDLFIRLSTLFEVSLDYLILGKTQENSLNCTNTAQLKADIEQLITHLEQFKGKI